MLLIALLTFGYNRDTQLIQPQVAAKSVNRAITAKPPTGKPQIFQSRGSIDAVTFSPDGTLLAAVADGKVKIWNVKSKRLKRTLRRQEPAAFSVAFSPDGKTVASPGAERFEAGHLTLWNIQSGKIIRSLTAHDDTGHLLSVAFSPNGNLIAGGSENSKIVLWDVRTGEVKRTQDCPGDLNIVVGSIAFSPNGEILAAGGNNKIFLWNAPTGKLQHSITTWDDTPIGPVFLAFSKDSKILAAQGGNYENRSPESYRGYISLWSVQSGKLQRRLPKHASWVTSICFSPDGKIIASGNDEGNIRLWNVQTGILEQTLKGHRKEVNSVAISPDGKLLASGSNDGTLKVWRLN